MEEILSLSTRHWSTRFSPLATLMQSAKINPGNMSTFHLLNFGCRASQADGAALKKQLLDAGLREVESAEHSRVAILNTCTVTADADAEVRQVIRRIHRANPQCRILVTGCYAQRAPEEIARIEGVAWVVGNSHKHTVAEVLSAAVGREREGAGREDSGRRSQLVGVPSSVCSQPLVEISNVDSVTPARESAAEVMVGEISEEFHFAPVFPDDRTRPTLKVQDGCNARCSFCIIPAVRGASRSLAPDLVVEQVRKLERAGFKEIVLSGINLGSYGRDLDRRITFLGLLERILGETSIPRIRISSIEPMDVSPALIRLLAQEPRMAQHFHVPLQSGCDRILRQMSRRYWARQYAERLARIREQIPNCGIGADVMVGFPGETDQDHASSARFIESLPLTYVHVFPYSARPMTPAASKPKQVNGRVARDRGWEIRHLVAAKHRSFLAAQVGRALSAITLGELNDGTRMALTTNYLKVALPGSTTGQNVLLDVEVGRADDNLLYGYARESSFRSGELLSIQAQC
jgi:threonylcarbamoyladenosine tRNA methylthiotransferase MtaB